MTAQGVNPDREFLDAVYAGDLIGAEAWLDKGANVGAVGVVRATHERAIVTAAEHGRLDIVTMLMRRGACGRDNYHAIKRAAQVEHYGVMEALLAADASPTALHYAGEGLCMPRRRCGNAPEGNRAAAEVFRSLLGRGMPVDQATTTGEMLMWLAADSGQVDIMRAIIATGHDASFDDLALKCAAQNGHIEALRLLVEHGVNVNHDHGVALCSAVGCVTYNHHKFGATKEEAFAAFAPTVEELLALGADPAMRSYEAPRVAAMAGMIDVVALFLKAGVPPLEPFDITRNGAKLQRTLREIAVKEGRGGVVACIDAFVQAQLLATAHPQAGRQSEQRPASPDQTRAVRL